MMPAKPDILPILYSFRRCPYAMRARMAMLASGAAYIHREVLLRDKPAAMLAVSPKGTIPVLVLVDGSVIDESIDIMSWALAQYDPEQWLSHIDADLIEIFDGTFKYHLDRYKYANRLDVDPLAHRAAGLAILAGLDERLSGQNYLGGATRGFSDIALFPFVRQFAAVDADWFATRGPVAVRQWLAALMASDLFQRAMVPMPLWAE
jgi:glutathione S-transferase